MTNVLRGDRVSRAVSVSTVAFFLLFLPLRADALPTVITAASAQVFLSLLPLFAGVATIREYRRWVAVLFAIIVVLVGYGILQNLEVRRIHQKPIIHDDIDGQLQSHLTPEQARTLYSTSPATIITLHNVESAHVTGSGMYFYRDLDRIQKQIEQHPVETNIIVVSESVGALSWFSNNYRGAHSTFLVPLPWEQGVYMAPIKSSSRLANPREPTRSDTRDLIFFAGPNFIIDQPPVLSQVYNYAHAMVTPDDALARQLSGRRRSNSATVLLPVEEGSGDMANHVNRFIKHSGYDDIEIVPWITEFGKQRYPFGNYYFDNFYRAWDVSAAFDANPSGQLVCLSRECLRYVPNSLTTYVDANRLLRISDGRLELTDSAKSVAQKLAGNQEIIFVAENAEEHFLAQTLSVSAQEYGAPISGFASNPRTLFLSAKGHDPYRLLQYHLTTSWFANPIAMIRDFLHLVRVESTAASFSAISVWGLFLGLLISRRGWLLYIPLVASIILYSYRYDWLHIAPADYPIFLLPPMALGSVGLAVAALCCLKRRVALGILALISSWYFAQVADPVMQCLAIFSALGALISYHISRRGPVVHAPALPVCAHGPKSRDSLDLVPGYLKGWIVESTANYADLPLRRHSKYLLRSNHRTSLEQRGAGLFKSYGITRKTAQATWDLAMREARSTLHETQIQFWLQPYVHFDRTGVARSLADSDPLSFEFALGEPEAVTAGQSATTETVSRHNPGGAISIRILRALNRAEQSLGGPVVMEFGVKGRSIVCLQARRDIEHPYLDAPVAAAICSAKKAPEPLGTSPGSLLIHSVMSRFHCNAVFFIGDRLFAIPTARPRRPDSHRLKAAVTEIIDLAITPSSAPSLPLEVEAFGKQFDLLFGLKQSFRSLDASLSFLLRDIERVLKSVADSPVDAEQSWVVTENDFYHVLVTVAIESIKRRYGAALLDQNNTIHRYTTGRAEPPPLISSNCRDLKTVYPGDLSRPRISIDDLSSGYPANAAARMILECDAFPVEQMSLLNKVYGVYCRSGSTLSHLAIHCRANRIPCWIEC